MQFGQLHRRAPELRVPYWIDAEGRPIDRPLSLADLGAGWKILFAFQHWCPGCHSRGFPTLQVLHRALKDKGVGFAAIQTVFEGETVNTMDKLAENQARYNLPIPFGHDPRPEEAPYPTFMEDYRSAGTPWFTIIEPGGVVAFADFRLDPTRFLAAWDGDDMPIPAGDKEVPTLKKKED